jgi:hypothetical protein
LYVAAQLLPQNFLPFGISTEHSLHLFIFELFISYTYKYKKTFQKRYIVLGTGFEPVLPP